MNAQDLKGLLIGARGYKVLSLYSNYTAPFNLKKKITTKGGILSKVVDIQGRPTSSGNELMIGLQDEDGTSWVLYQPDLFFYGGKTEGDKNSNFITVDSQSIDKLAESNSLTNAIIGPLKKFSLIGLAILAIVLIKRK